MLKNFIVLILTGFLLHSLIPDYSNAQQSKGAPIPSNSQINSVKDALP